MKLTKLSLVGKLDNGLTKGLCLLLRALMTVGLWLLGVMSLVLLPGVVFEYGEGLADISLLEWGFMLLLGLLLWRHLHFCKHFRVGIWRGLSRLLVFQGAMNALAYFLVGFYAIWLVQGEDIQEYISSLRRGVPVNKFFGFLWTLLTLYLAAPTATAAEALSPLAEAPGSNQPVITPAAKEARP